MLSGGLVLACGNDDSSVDGSKKLGDLNQDEAAQVCQDAEKMATDDYKRGYCRVDAALQNMGLPTRLHPLVNLSLTNRVDAALQNMGLPTDEEAQSSCAISYQSCMDEDEQVGDCSFEGAENCTVSDTMTCLNDIVGWYASWANWDCSQLKASDDASNFDPPATVCEAYLRCVN